ncbi:MAG TPA: ABC transporter permease [Acidobacteriota bacterium]|nr:ABC transporter permease [Acidobacteriota bacterium]
MSTIWNDLRYGIRVLAKHPGFTLVALLTLAIGIGANSAIFSVVHGVLLKPLPYRQPQQLVQIWSQFPTMDFFEFPVSPPEYYGLRERADFLRDLGGYSNGGANLTGDGEPLRLSVSYATHSLLPTLGVDPLYGRFFREEEDLPENDKVVLLSYGLWKQKFAGDPEVIGRKVEIDGEPVEVIGVMPAQFNFPTADIQAWMPIAIDPASVPNRWGNHLLQVVARLEDGVTVEEARQQLRALVAGWGDEGGPGHHRPNPEFHPYILNALHEQMVGSVRPQMVFLTLVVGLVLLIACVNVANLLLARSEARQKEIAIRSALGAERGRLIRQLLTESTLLAVGGGVIGMLVANWGVQVLLAVNPESIPRLDAIGLDWTVAGATLALSFVTGLVFGAAPAVTLLSGDVQETLKDGGRGTSASRGRNRFRGLLVTVEIALAVVLVAGSGLVIRSFAALQSTDPGFDAESALTLRTVVSPTAAADNESVVAFYERALERLSALPGVRSAAAVSSLPLRSYLNANDFQIEGWVRTADSPPVNVDYQQVVSPGYFKTMGIELRAGRTFTPADRPGSLPVTVVSQSFVDRFFPGENALGKRVRANSERPWMEIVGVVEDVKQVSLRDSFKPHMYTSLAQNPEVRGFAYRGMSFVLRTGDAPLSLAGTARDAIWQLDSDIPIADVETLESVLGVSLAEQRFTVLLLSIFAVTALLLAAVGVYGVMSYSVTQRTQEIGVRMAMGARAADVLRLVVRQGMLLTSIGLVLGLVAALSMALLLRDQLQDMLYRIGNLDPLTYIAVLALLTLTALLACCLPAYRASRLDPLRALHYE